MRILSFRETNKSKIKNQFYKNWFKQFISSLLIPPNIQVVFGLGAPITLQDNITSFPSKTVVFWGSFSIIGPVAVT